MPVSTTHAIVGGVVGMTMAGAGASCLNWEIDGENARSRALLLMPILFSATSFILVLVTTLKAKAIKKELGLNTKLILSTVVGVSVGMVAFFVVTPYVKKTFPSEQKDVAGDGKTDVELQKTATGEVQTATEDTSKPSKYKNFRIC